VPALRVAEFLPKAERSGADAIILDLEAATPPERRTVAAAALAGLDLRSSRVPVFVRVNEVTVGSLERVEHELRVAVEIGATGVLLSRVMAPDDVRRASEMLAVAERGRDAAELAIVPMIETASAVMDAVAIGRASPRVGALALGGEDLSADIGATRTPDGAEIAFARGLIVLAAAAAGCGALDTPWMDLGDNEGLTREAARARQLGFAGKLAINPRQVPGIMEGLTPDAAEVAQARAIVVALEAAIRDGSGIAVVGGKMIDDPVARAARRTLDRTRAAS
jgi:citrate lyase subunit beta/citryl-CoA lyase